MFVIEGTLRRQIKSGLIFLALARVFGEPRQVRDSELDRLEEGPPVEILEGGTGPAFVVVGGRRWPIRGLPLPYLVSTREMLSVPEAEELNFAAALVLALHPDQARCDRSWRARARARRARPARQGHPPGLAQGDRPVEVGGLHDRRRLVSEHRFGDLDLGLARTAIERCVSVRRLGDGLERDLEHTARHRAAPRHGTDRADRSGRRCPRGPWDRWSSPRRTRRCARRARRSDAPMTGSPAARDSLMTMPNVSAYGPGSSTICMPARRNSSGRYSLSYGPCECSCAEAGSFSSPK